MRILFMSLIAMLTGCAAIQQHKPEQVAVVEKKSLTPAPVRKACCYGKRQPVPEVLFHAAVL